MPVGEITETASGKWPTFGAIDDEQTASLNLEIPRLLWKALAATIVGALVLCTRCVSLYRTVGNWL